MENRKLVRLQKRGRCESASFFVYIKTPFSATLKLLLPLFLFFYTLICHYMNTFAYLCSKIQIHFFMLTDIEIAKSVKLRPINEVAAELGIHEDQVENYGRYIAKILRTRSTLTSLRTIISSSSLLSALPRQAMARPPYL